MVGTVEAFAWIEFNRLAHAAMIMRFHDAYGDVISSVACFSWIITM